MALRHGRDDPTPPIASSPLSTYTGADGFYRTGVGDPPHSHDPGAGPWGSHKPTLAVFAKKEAIVDLLATGATWGYPGRNATAHLQHYFGNTGATYTIDLEDMLQFVPSAKAAMVNEFRHAQEFVQTLPEGRHQFTARTPRIGYNRQVENADWFFGIGGYTRWGKGEVTITTNGKLRHYEMDFTYCFYDRYNWDGGKSVHIGPYEITDEFMGEFHRQGLAKEYDCIGQVKRHLAWDGEFGAVEDATILAKPGR